MGIDRHFADFLMFARDDGVGFDRVATLGRLNLFVDHRSLGAIFRKHGLPATDEDIRTVRGAADGYAESFLQRLGARECVSIDASSYERASLVHDMNRPIPDELKGRFSVVIDGGTLEHVFNFPVAIQNCMDLLRVGGHFFAHTMANNFMGHGFYQFSPELFYRVSHAPGRRVRIPYRKAEVVRGRRSRAIGRTRRTHQWQADLLADTCRTDRRRAVIRSAAAAGGLQQIVEARHAAEIRFRRPAVTVPPLGETA